MRLLSFAILLTCTATLDAAEPFLLRDGQRVVFLGDSNTFAGHFVAYVDGYLRTRFPDQKFELINLGLPSETVSGLSEPDHPYPRPTVHERLDRVLARTKPDVVIACYGMNDGIYYPFSEERLKQYQHGMKTLIEKSRKAGAKQVVLMTPAPFDPTPLRAKVLPADAAKFSWMRPYEKYDDVLGRYSDWLLTLRKEHVPVADPHTAVNRFLTAVRKDDPKFVISGDGIHPSPTGHAIVVGELLHALHAPAEVDHAAVDAATRRVITGRVAELRASADDKITFTWTTRVPMPADARWDARLEELVGLGRRFNQHRLTVTGLKSERYNLYEGDRRVGTATKAELEAGLDLLRFAELTTNRRASELGKLIGTRTQILGLAWLSDVGHKRPDTPKGLALAEAEKQVARLDEQIRALSRPVTLTLKLSPAR